MQFFVIFIVRYLPKSTTNVSGTSRSFSLALNEYVHFRTSFPFPVFVFGEAFFMFVMFVDEGNELIWFNKEMLLFSRTEHEDISV